MFIKKDRRRIDEILSDESDSRESLQLSKRTPEFNGTVKVLCREVNLPFLANLRVLNLYDNSLTSLTGIGCLAQTPLEEINLGCNSLNAIPLEFGSIRTLKSVWLDDNHFEEFPAALCRLTGLKTLRISGNQICEIPDLISCLDSLEVLAIDNNRLTSIPHGMFKLIHLKSLWLRQNKLTNLPMDIDLLTALEVLSVSSNQLTELPESLSNITSLKKLYANGNSIEIVPLLLTELTGLQEINLANNKIQKIPSTWQSKWGQADKVTGQLTKDDKQPTKCKVVLIGNANVF